MWQISISVCTCVGPSPWPMVIFSDLVIQIGTSVSQPIRCESDDLMSGWVLYLMLDIITPPLPVCLLLLDNLLGYRGPTTVKPDLCLNPTLRPRPWVAPARDYIAWLGWTVRGAHLHHALGTSQVRASGPHLHLLRGLGSNRISGALGAHLDHPEPGPPKGGARGLKS